MGWSSGWRTYDELKNHLLKGFSSGYEVIEHKSTNYGRNLWISVKETATGLSFIYLAIIKRFKDEGWGYKDLSESSGPCEVDCPLSMLDSTTGDAIGCGVEWRKSVRKYHARIKDNSSEIKIGEIVQMYSERYEIVAKKKRTYIGIEISTGNRYKLRTKDIVRLNNAEDFILNKTGD